MSRIDTVDTETSPRATLNWFSCSKCHKRFGTPGDVLQHEKKSQCSLEPQGKLATSGYAEAVLKTADESSPELNSRLTSPTRNSRGLSKLGHFREKADMNVAATTVERHIPGIRLCVSEPLGDTLRGDSTIIPNNVHTSSIRSIHSNETGLSISRHSTGMADTESSDLDSTSQTSNPHAVHEFRHLDTGNTLTQRFPSTASQPEEPILQVKRTPHINGRRYNVGSQIFRPHRSPPNKKPPSSASTAYDKDAAGTTSREPFGIDISIAETQPTKRSEDFSIVIDGGQASRQRSSEDLDEESIAQQVQHEIDSQSQRSLNKIPALEESLIDTEHTILPDTSNLENSTLMTSEGVSPITKDRDNGKSKRKCSEAQLLSPNVTKRRRRRSKSPESLRLTQGEQIMPDPSISGRLWRQEHFASRKDFMSLPKEEDQTYLSPSDRTSSPSSQSQDKTSRIIQTEIVGIKGDSKDQAMDLGVHSPSAKARHGSDSNRSVAPVESHKLNSIPSTVISHESLHHRQTRLQAANGEQLDVVMLDADIQDNRSASEEQPQTTSHTVGTEFIQLSPRLNIFDRFKISYPDYTGNTEQFVNICNKIQNLVKAGREEHQTLWDDFIVRYNTEYPRYINQCVNMAEDPVPYEQYYRNEVLEARYNKLVVTRKTLSDALVLKHHVPESPRPQQPNHTTEDVHVPANLGTKTPLNSSRGPFRVSRQPSPPTVDLTDEIEDSLTVQGFYPLPRSEMKPPRSHPSIGSDKSRGTSYGSDVTARSFSPSNVPLSNNHSKPGSQSGPPSRLRSASSRDSLGSSPTRITTTR